MIDTVTVRVRCVDPKDAFGVKRCVDDECVKCGGSGAYSVEMSWNDFVEELRAELSPRVSES